MQNELAYAIITPHSLEKSRTGVILARLIARTGLELVAARMFAPSTELASEFAKNLISETDRHEPWIQELLRDYVTRRFSPDHHTGRRNRAMIFVLRGENAVEKIHDVVGHVRVSSDGGQTIRDSLGDLVLDETKQVQYFEPAVLVANSPDKVESHLKIWSRYSDADGGLLENLIEYPANATPEKTLVLIKPDNFRFPTGRPGNVLDFFSGTGLYIVSIKVTQISVAEAEEFYGPVREVLRTKLNDRVAGEAKEALEKAFQFPIPPREERQLGEILGPIYGDNQFDNIVRFMTGRSVWECDEKQKQEPGTEKCLALIYEGVDAVKKIREVLGPTDPSKAPPGTIRAEFGSNIMVNAAHASDSPKSAEREMGIIRVGENAFRRVIEEHYR